MKKLLILLIIGLVMAGCESPLDVGVVELEPAGSGALFLRDLYFDGSSNQPGYESGRVRSDRILLEWEQYGGEDFLYYGLKPENLHERYFNAIETTSWLDTLYIDQGEEIMFTLNVMTENGMYARDTLTVTTPRWQAPDNLSVNRLSEHDIIFAWNDNCDTERWQRVYLYDENMTVLDSLQAAANATEQFISGLDEDAQYICKVKAGGQWEEDVMSYGMGFVIEYNNNLNAPITHGVEQELDDTATIFWEDRANSETGFEIERSVNNGEYELIAEIDYLPGMSSLSEYKDESSQLCNYGDTLSYRLRAFNDYGQETMYSGYSNLAGFVLVDMTTLVLIELQVDEWSTEASWNIMYEDGTFYYGEDQGFYESYQQVSRYVFLPVGNYAIICYDSYNDGGIAGSVSYREEVLCEWGQDDYNNQGTFWFEIEE